MFKGAREEPRDIYFEDPILAKDEDGPLVRASHEISREIRIFFGEQKKREKRTAREGPIVFKLFSIYHMRSRDKQGLPLLVNNGRKLCQTTKLAPRRSKRPRNLDY